MNLVGKIFTVLIFVMSLVCMGFAVSVYAMHRNWRDVVLRPAEATPAGEEIGLVHQLKQQVELNRTLEEKRAKLEADLNREKKAHEQAHGKLESEYKLLTTENTQLTQQYAKEVNERRKAVAAVTAAHQTLEKLRGEVDTLRTNITEARKDRDAHFKKVVQLEDELIQSVNERERLRKRMADLAEDARKAETVLKHFGYDKDMSLDPFPPIVNGLVAGVPKPGLVEISIGSDDGLQVGHKLEVLRKAAGRSIYVGRIQVVRTTFDKAACKVDPNFRKSNVQIGDRVTSKIQ